jgi:23S rRNA pseudouridine2457 synthase
MRVAIKFLRVNAILHEHEFYAGNFQAGFFLDLAAQRGLGSLAPFDFAAGNAPQVRPLVRANHQHVTFGIKNQGPDGRERRVRFRELFHQRFEVEIIFLQHAAQFGEMLDDQVRLGFAQSFQRVVAGQHGARMDAAVFGGLDVVLHIADEKRFRRLQIIFFENLVDFLSLVPNVGVRLVEKGVEAGHATVCLEVFGVDGAQQKRAKFSGAAKFQKVARVRQFGHGSLRLPEAVMKPVFKLRQRDVRRVTVVKLRERQGKFRAELFARHFGFARLRQNKIGRLQNGGQIVNQSAGPVEDNVADHAENLTAKTPGRQDKQKFSLCLCVSVANFRRTMLIAFHKPFGVLSQFTGDGSPNRPLAEFGFPKNVYAIGRLDADSEGLLLLSDEPAWNEKLLHPRHAHEREYWAQVEKIPSPESLKKLEKGISIQGRKTLPCRAWLLEPQPEIRWGEAPDEPNVGHLKTAARGDARPTKIQPRVPPIRFRKSVPDCWIGLELIEGKNRQVRRMTAAIGHPTLRLLRVRIGNFWLGDLPAGQWKILSVEEGESVLSQK